MKIFKFFIIKPINNPSCRIDVIVVNPTGSLLIHNKIVGAFK